MCTGEQQGESRTQTQIYINIIACSIILRSEGVANTSKEVVLMRLNVGVPIRN